MAEKYDYREVVKEDIREWIDENLEYITDGNGIDRESCYDQMWIADSVTGNGSGSYTFNTARAKEYVEMNFDLAMQAYKEFGCLEKLMEDIEEEHWEAIDVSIRCYLLGEFCDSIIEEFERGHKA